MYINYYLSWLTMGAYVSSRLLVEASPVDVVRIELEPRDSDIESLSVVVCLLTFGFRVCGGRGLWLSL